MHMQIKSPLKSSTWNLRTLYRMTSERSEGRRPAGAGTGGDGGDSRRGRRVDRARAQGTGAKGREGTDNSREGRASYRRDGRAYRRGYGRDIPGTTARHTAGQWPDTL